MQDFFQERPQTARGYMDMNLYVYMNLNLYLYLNLNMYMYMLELPGNAKHCRALPGNAQQCSTVFNAVPRGGRPFAVVRKKF